MRQASIEAFLGYWLGKGVFQNLTNKLEQNQVKLSQHN